MWEGPSYTPSALEVNHEILKSQLQIHTDELQRLRTLLDTNKIPWAKPAVQSSSSHSKRILRSSSQRQTTLFPWARSAAVKQKIGQKQLPHLPAEILLRILNVAMVQPHPVIDPFWKLLPENLTSQEQKNPSLSLGLLSVNKLFREEGIKMFIMGNQFIFTQVEALQNFARFSPESRASIQHVTLRIIAKYYDDTAYKKVLRGNGAYHAVLESPIVWVKARPSVGPLDKGIQSYSWQQFMDFLQALVLYRRSSSNGQHQVLFSNLKSMRIDCVNFSDHIPFLGSPLISILRWHVGQLVEELTITGLVEEDLSNGETRFLQSLVKDNGIFGSGVPLFASAKSDRLKDLPGYDLELTLVKPTISTSTDSISISPTHPEGGTPPKSVFPSDLTIWKYVSDSLANPSRKWIEFHRRCGQPVDACGELQVMREEAEANDDTSMSSSSSNTSSSDAQMLDDEWEDDGGDLD